jgi:hypothetical protein
MTFNRRNNFRIPYNRLITEFSSSKPFVSAITNLSNDGMFTVKPADNLLTPTGRIQVEIPLPEANETLWATGEIMFERHGSKSVGAGIQFKNMSRAHKNLLSDIVEEGRQKILKEMLAHIMWQKELLKYPTVKDAPLPIVTEHTVPLFRLSTLDSKFI